MNFAPINGSPIGVTSGLAGLNSQVEAVASATADPLTVARGYTGDVVASAATTADMFRIVSLQPVGYGPELFADIGFDNPSAWTYDPLIWSVHDGIAEKLIIDQGAITQSLPVQNNTLYQGRMSVLTFDGPWYFDLRINQPSGTIIHAEGPGDYVNVAENTLGTGFIDVEVFGAIGVTGTVDNVSLREVSGAYPIAGVATATGPLDVVTPLGTADVAASATADAVILRKVPVSGSDVTAEATTTGAVERKRLLFADVAASATTTSAVDRKRRIEADPVFATAETYAQIGLFDADIVATATVDAVLPVLVRMPMADLSAQATATSPVPGGIRAMDGADLDAEAIQVTDLTLSARFTANRTAQANAVSSRLQYNANFFANAVAVATQMSTIADMMSDIIAFAEAEAQDILVTALFYSDVDAEALTEATLHGVTELPTGAVIAEAQATGAQPQSITPLPVADVAAAAATTEGMVVIRTFFASVQAGSATHVASLPIKRYIPGSDVTATATKVAVLYRNRRVLSDVQADAMSTSEQLRSVAPLFASRTAIATSQSAALGSYAKVPFIGKVTSTAIIPPVDATRVAFYESNLVARAVVRAVFLDPETRISPVARTIYVRAQDTLYLVPYEDRDFAIWFNDRDYTVPYQDRLLEVPEGTSHESV